MLHNRNIMVDTVSDDPPNPQGWGPIELHESNSSPIEFHPIRKRPKLHDQIITKEEFMHLLRAGSARDKAILSLAILGLRAGEIGQASTEWVDWHERILTIPSAKAKKGKGRRIFFGFSPIWEVLSAYFVLENEVFPSNPTANSRITVWRRVKALSKKVGLRKPLTPHGLRATGATWAANSGLSAQAIREMFGWAKLETAERYIAMSGRTAERELKEKGGYI